MAVCPRCDADIPAGSPVCPACHADLSATPPRGRARSRRWIVLGVLALLVVTAPLWLGWFGQVRDFSRRGSSEVNLKNMGSALTGYVIFRESLPPGGTLDAEGRGYHGWPAMLLAYYNVDAFYTTIDFNQPWDAEVNRAPFETPQEMYLNPSAIPEDTSGLDGYAPVHYTANSKMFWANSTLQKTDVTDGLATTIFMGEAGGNYLPWGHPSNFRDPTVAFGTPEGFGSARDDVLFLMGDGSVKVVQRDIRPKLLEALSTPAGGEYVDPDKFPYTEPPQGPPGGQQGPIGGGSVPGGS